MFNLIWEQTKRCFPQKREEVKFYLTLLFIIFIPITIAFFTTERYKYLEKELVIHGPFSLQFYESSDIRTVTTRLELHTVDKEYYMKCKVGISICNHIKERNSIIKFPKNCLAKYQQLKASKDNEKFYGLLRRIDCNQKVMHELTAQEIDIFTSSERKMKTINIVIALLFIIYLIGTVFSLFRILLKSE